MAWADSGDIDHSSVFGRTLKRTTLIDSKLGVDTVKGIATDWINDKVYWTDSSKGSILQASATDGSGVATIITGLTSPYAIVVDPLNRYLIIQINT